MSDFLKNLIPESQKQPTIEEQIVRDERPIEEVFHSALPDSLYMNHYDLHADFPFHTAEAWRRYLKENDRFILQEVAAVTEANARQGLKHLASGTLKQGDATAITQLLNRSEQLNLAVKDKTVYMTTFLPDPSTLDAPNQKGIAEQVLENKQHVRNFYPPQVLHIRMTREEIVENEDGTAHFPIPEAITHLDRVYMSYHNPENKLINELVDGDLGWQ